MSFSGFPCATRYTSNNATLFFVGRATRNSQLKGIFISAKKLSTLPSVRNSSHLARAMFCLLASWDKTQEICEGNWRVLEKVYYGMWGRAAWRNLLLPLSGQIIQTSGLYELLVPTYQTTRRHIPEDNNIDLYHAHGFTGHQKSGKLLRRGSPIACICMITLGFSVYF